MKIEFHVWRKENLKEKNESKFSDWSGDAIGLHIFHQIQKQLFIGILTK